jgi:sporulation protein YlmC with PRC-barrel domain
MRVSHLLSVPILSLRASLKMARVEAIYLDPDMRALAALAIRPPGGRQTRLLPRAAITHIGRHGVVLAGDDADPPLAFRAHAEELLPLRALLGKEMVTAGGAWIGQVCDAELDAITLDVTHLEVAPSATTYASSGRETLHVATHRLISNGADALVVAE